MVTRELSFIVRFIEPFHTPSCGQIQHTESQTSFWAHLALELETHLGLILHWTRLLLDVFDECVRVVSPIIGVFLGG